MLEIGAGENDIFRHLQQVQIADMHHQAHGYFGIIGNKNAGNEFLTNPSVVSYPQNLT